MGTLTSTDLAKKLGIDSKILTKKLVELKLVYFQDGKKHLTKSGHDLGGPFFAPSAVTITKEKLNASWGAS